LQHHHPRLSDQAALFTPAVQAGGLSLPYPLYAAITRAAEQLEFSPHEVSFPAAMDASIPTWSLGRTFFAGKELRPGDSVESSSSSPSSGMPVVHPPALVSPEPSLAFLLACFASAHPTRIGRMLEELIYTSSSSRREPLLRLLHALLHDTLGLGHESAFSAATVPSFLVGMDKHAQQRALAAGSESLSGCAPIPSAVTADTSTSEFEGLSRTLQLDPSLSLMDAGLAFNLPFPPLLHPARGVDIILALDASSPPEALRADALRLAAEYASRSGLGIAMPDLAQSVQMPVTEAGFDEAHAERLLADVSFSSSSSSSPSPAGGSPAAAQPTPFSEALSIARSLARASESICSVFPGDVARGVPTVVYIPLIANETFVPSAEYLSHTEGDERVFDPRRNFVRGGFCATLNFSYADWQSETIMSLSELNARQSLPVLRAVCRRVWQEKKQLRLAQKRTGGDDKS
jgi:hypothetical protein